MVGFDIWRESAQEGETQGLGFTWTYSHILTFQCCHLCPTCGNRCRVELLALQRAAPWLASKRKEVSSAETGPTPGAPFKVVCRQGLAFSLASSLLTIVFHLVILQGKEGAYLSFCIFFHLSLPGAGRRSLGFFIMRNEVCAWKYQLRFCPWHPNNEEAMNWWHGPGKTGTFLWEWQHLVMPRFLHDSPKLFTQPSAVYYCFLVVDPLPSRYYLK